MSFGVLPGKLHSEKASAEDTGVVAGPEFAGGAVAVTFDDHAGEPGRLAWIVSMLNDVLQAEAVGLVLKHSLMPIDDGNHSQLGKKNSHISNEAARHDSGYQKPDALRPGFVDFPPVVRLQGVRD